MTSKSLRILAAGLALPLLLPADAAVRINEVADKGTPGTCGGADWIELSLPATASAPVDLTAGYVLHDGNGAGDDDVLDFAALAGTLAPLEPGDYLLLCRGDDFAFGIGGDDTVTLVDAAGAVASTTGVLLGQGDEGVAYAFDDAAGAYAYTTTPTPGQANVVTPPEPPESVDEMRARLVAQDAEGRPFFDMGPDGRRVEGGFAEVVDLNVQMDPDLRRDMHERGESHGTWRGWESATITDRDGAVLLELPSPGRIRPKGQSTLYVGACMDRAVPYSLDFGRGAEGSDPDQTLFGVERAYLRTHYGDGSYAREWAAHRMLARFGLPHLRTRKVRLYINGKYEGLFDLTEAPDQDYVHQRSFPGFDPEGTALYKVKSMSLLCGNFDTFGMLIFGAPLMEAAQARVDEPGTPPYHFERGEHLPIIEVKKDVAACTEDFFSKGIRRDGEDTALAFIRSGEECGEFLVDAGLVDRDLGRKDTEGAMAAFVNAHLGPSTCDPGCANSDLANDVDLTNYLRNAAAHAAMLNQDSPMGNGNNYYLALNGGRWSMVQWDHNNIMSGAAGALCDAAACPSESVVDWDIRRPTCRSYEQNQMYGPLLSDPALRARYLGYLQEFVDDVMTDEEFLGQVRAHLEAIQGDVADDSWSDDVRLFPKELSASDDEVWLHEGYYMTLLGTMRARASSIAAQLEAIDAGTSPRALADIGPGEACVDWRLDGPRESPQGCPDDCQYEGCAMPGAVIPGFCDPESQTCVHGVSDDKCEGIPNLQGYEGIEPFEGSNVPPFCFTDDSVGLGPTKMAQCPPKEEEGVECPDDCQYEGCYREGFAVPGLCDPDSGCVHGILDAKCQGIPDLQQYEGMESFEGSDEPAICIKDPASGAALKMAQCPPKKEEEGVKCPDDCQYEGCYREGFTVPGLCDPDSGCVHGILDAKCQGIPNLQQYEGMESFEGSDEPAICFTDPTSGVALKMAQCPAMKDAEPAPTPKDPEPKNPAPTASPTGASAPSPDEGATVGGGKVGGGGTSSGPGIAASTLFAFRMCAGVVLAALLAI